jgi:putative FmdB family regulatory protein
MPIYEFECQECHHQVELLVRNSEQPACPQCASQRLEKLMSAVAVSGKNDSLPMANSSPPKSHGGCGPGCCRVH